MDDDAIDTEGLVAWLAAAVDPSISSATVTKLAGGHSSGAWRVDVSGHDLPPLVLKAPAGDSVVFRRDAAREARILDAAGRAGAPVPAVVAVDAGGDCDRPSLLRDGARRRAQPRRLLGRRVPRRPVAPRDRRRRAASPRGRASTDALGALHSIDASAVAEARHGPEGLVDVLGYWRAALLDVAPAATVPRQLALLDWLAANLPPGADDDPALCMGDARFVNCLIDGDEVRALVDFEVAYLGNPAADVAYSTFVDAMQRQSATNPLPGIGDAAEAWARWSRATGRDVRDHEYWTAFGATVIVVTATRAMVLWGLSGPDVESDNPLVGAWEAAVDEAKAR